MAPSRAGIKGGADWKFCQFGHNHLKALTYLQDLPASEYDAFNEVVDVAAQLIPRLVVVGRAAEKLL